MPTKYKGPLIILVGGGLEFFLSGVMPKTRKILGFAGFLKIGAAKKSGPHRELAKNMCPPIGDLPKKVPPQNSPPINDERSLKMYSLQIYMLDIIIQCMG